MKNQQKLKDKKMKLKDKIFRDTMRIILSVPWYQVPVPIIEKVYKSFGHFVFVLQMVLVTIVDFLVSPQVSR